MKPIQIVMVDPGTAPYMMYIANDLKTLQDMVGGYIETRDCRLLQKQEFPPSSTQARLPTHHLVAVFNEEGIRLNLPPNRHLPDGTLILGSFFITAQDGAEFRSLTYNEVDEAIEAFIQPGDKPYPVSRLVHPEAAFRAVMVDMDPFNEEKP